LVAKWWKFNPKKKTTWLSVLMNQHSQLCFLSDPLQEGFRKQLCFLNGQLSPRQHFCERRLRISTSLCDHFHWQFFKKNYMCIFWRPTEPRGEVFDKFKERQSKRVYKLMNFCIWLSNSTIQKLGCGSQIFPIMNFECGHQKLTIKLTQDAITSY
jgi:hypothetical protein